MTKPTIADGLRTLANRQKHQVDSNLLMRLAREADEREARLAEYETLLAKVGEAFDEGSACIAELRARLAEAERKIADALATAGGRWCEWGSRAESVRDILDGTASSATAQETDDAR